VDTKGVIKMKTNERSLAVKDLLEEIRELKEQISTTNDYNELHYLKGELFEDIDRLFEETGDLNLVEGLLK